MVIKINDIGCVNSRLNYNFKKIEKGDAEISFSNLLENKKEKIKDYFSEVGKLNDRVEKKFLSGILSFSEADGKKTNSKERVDLLLEILEKNKIKNVPLIAFEHRDTKNPHLHFYLSKVDLDGKKINDSFLKKKFAASCKELEEKYNLSKDHEKTNKIPSKKLDEINYQKYKMHRALKTMFEKKYNFEIFGKNEELEKILKIKKDLSFEELEKKLPQNLFEGLQFASKKWEKRNFKHDIQGKLNDARKLAKNQEEFEKILKEKGVYYYDFVNEKGNRILKYGFKAHSVYFGEDALSEKYQYQNLKQYFEKKPMLDGLNQLMEKNIEKVKNIEELKSVFAKQGILFSPKEKDFSLIIGKDEIKNEEIGFDFRKIEKKLKENQFKDEIRGVLKEKSFKDFLEKSGYKINYLLDENGEKKNWLFKKENIVISGEKLGIEISQNIFNFSEDDFGINKNNQKYFERLEEEEEEERKKKKKRKDFGLNG